MSLAIRYSKEIIAELKKIPVFLPGEDVNVGDVIAFNTSKGLLSKIQPVGPFEHVTSLHNLNVPFSLRPKNSDPQPYTYSSKDQVSITFSASANVKGVAKNKETLTVEFKEAGATYFYAVGCVTDKMDDLPNVGLLLRKHQKTLDWDEYFVVTSVTRAKKALIMQSNSNSARMEVTGDIKGLQTGQGALVDASAAVLSVQSKDAHFSKDWSDNVSVFFGLAKFKKTLFFGNRRIGNAKLSRDTFEDFDKFRQFTTYRYHDFGLEDVSISDLDVQIG